MIPAAVTRTLLGQEILVNGYFTSVLGSSRAEHGRVRGHYIAVFAGGVITINITITESCQTPWRFFNGKTLCPHGSHPLVRDHLPGAGHCLAGGSDRHQLLRRVDCQLLLHLACAGPFIYRNTGKASPPLRPAPYADHTHELHLLWRHLHHPHGVNAGSQVLVRIRCGWPGQQTLSTFQNAGDAAGYQNLLATITPARFKGRTDDWRHWLLLGIAWPCTAAWTRISAKNYRSMFMSTVLAVFLTGVTEPLEFMFMFCALPLYLVYAVLQGCAFAMAGLIHLRLHSFGNLEFLTRVPMSIRAGLGGDLINFILCVAVFFAAGYAIAYFMIGRFHLPPRAAWVIIPTTLPQRNSQGRAGSPSSGDSQAGRASSPCLGGRDNIVLVDACMTRLRVTVKDVDKVAGLPPGRQRVPWD